MNSVLSEDNLVINEQHTKWGFNPWTMKCVMHLIASIFIRDDGTIDMVNI